MELNKVAENISAINTPSVGIAGEVRCVVTGADGAIKTDTGYQKNLILNHGLEFFGGGKGTSINASCAIGSGNSAPAITQTGLDAFIALANAVSADTTSSYAYVDKGDNLYRMWEQKKYRFTGLANVNISEVGLVSTGTSSTTYYLTTRALIKDSLGAPTSISVKTGETLDIYYKIHKVIDTRDKSFVINVLDGNGGAVPYNVIIRPAMVGTNSWGNIGDVLIIPNSGWFGFSPSDVGAITSAPVGANPVQFAFSIEAYQAASYQRLARIAFPLDKANVGIRTVAIVSAQSFYFFPFQMRLGRVSDDAPLTKTANDTLSIPLEFSWGRFEGTL